MTADLPAALRHIVLTVPSLTAEQMASLNRAATLIDAIDAIASAPVVNVHMGPSRSNDSSTARTRRDRAEGCR